MGRIRKQIRIDGRDCWTLFDTGARNTYVVPEVASLLVTSTTTQPIKAALGGGTHQIHATAILEGWLEQHWISTHARVINKIGNDEDGRPIDILLGALAMQEWGIRLNPEKEELDLTHYPKEFVEF